MSVLRKKLLRDLSQLRGQVITIGLVVACGIASYVTMRSAFASLEYSRDAYYEHNRFADIFVRLERAPSVVLDELEELEGVAEVRGRVAQTVMVPMPDLPRPASGTVVSLSERPETELCAVHLRSGSLPSPGRSDEVLLLEAFAEAHGLQPGDTLPVVLNGRLRTLRISGLGMSPEFILTMPPGGMVFDPKQVAVFWMNEAAVQAAFQKAGSFDDVVMRLQPGASEAAVLQAVDRILAPYGGRGAVPRARQPSHHMLAGELDQLRGMARVVPAIFLFVAAFLLNVVLSRVISLQRSQIATLKAVGYRDAAIGLHFLQLVSLIVVAGAFVGTALGAYLGEQMTGLYTDEYFRFPSPAYRLEPQLVLESVGVSLLAAVAGAISAVRKVIVMPPAEAMQPPAPPRYGAGLVEWLRLSRWTSSATRMIVRELGRRPLRLVLSSVGIAMAIGIVITSRFMFDAIEHMLATQFHEAMREDVTVTFVKPLHEDAVRELARFPGVIRAEGQRVVAVRLQHQTRARDASIMVMSEDVVLRRIIDRNGQRVSLPAAGVLVSEALARVLELSSFPETVQVELREGTRAVKTLPVVGVVDDAFGLQVYASRDALEGFLGEEGIVHVGLLVVDPDAREAVMAQLKALPWVLSVSSPGDMRGHFEKQSGAVMGIYSAILTLFASIIAIGVVYNNARVALSTRSRDLASLRVLGFTRREIAWILFGEQGVQILFAIPMGLVVGYAMVAAIGTTVDAETYRMPVTISARTYVYAVLVAVVSGIVSAAMVRRKLERLDLIGVLKTRE